MKGDARAFQKSRDRLLEPDLVSGAFGIACLEHPKGEANGRGEE